ncbi:MULTISPECIES: hypothetical protein [Mesorhizobium]|uniref:Uncharacterized protein n=1 Tax=Mesorhizobium denitrificans TaxID=2294114 RepID=A0A371XJG4_9HYPH|nr:MULTISPECIES: hypothetical protein [Mesorhizobium]RFC69360.1 hypothetical protein DY251_01035 [Mesorhizobium denitrificans]
MGQIFSILWGERSLPFTYWICYIGGTILALTGIYGLAGLAGSFGSASTVKWVLFLSVSWGLFVTYFVGTAVVLSAMNRKEQDVWSLLAIATVGSIALYSTYDIIRKDGHNPEMTQEQLLREIKSLSKS